MKTLNLFNLYRDEIFAGSNNQLVILPMQSELSTNLLRLQQEILFALFEEIPNLKSFKLFSNWGRVCSVNGIDIPEAPPFTALHDLRSWLVEANIKESELELIKKISMSIPRNQNYFSREEYSPEKHENP